MKILTCFNRLIRLSWLVSVKKLFTATIALLSYSWHPKSECSTIQTLGWSYCTEIFVWEALLEWSECPEVFLSGCSNEVIYIWNAPLSYYWLAWNHRITQLNNGVEKKHTKLLIKGIPPKKFPGRGDHCMSWRGWIVAPGADLRSGKMTTNKKIVFL